MVDGFPTKTTTGGGSKRMTIGDWLPSDRVRGLPSKRGSSYPSGKLWPHGEFSLGYGRERPDGGPWHENPLQVSERAEERIREDWALARFPLDLSVPTNSHKSAKRGLKGMSGYGQQMVKAFGHIIQHRWPRHRKTLGTVTLPPMSRQARREVVKAWPELTRQWLQWLTRQLEQSGLPPAICSVTEIQPKRLAAQNEGYLHWHTLWINHPGRGGNWAVDPNDVRTWVDGALKRHCPSYTGGRVNVDTRRVEGTVAAYMAKYMSKGKQMVSEALQDWGEDNVPATWWNMTAAARRAVKAATLSGRAVGRVLEQVLEQASDFEDGQIFAFLSRVTVEFDGVPVGLGWRGRFQGGVDMYVCDLLKSHDIV